MLCENLTSVVIGSGVTTIQGGAFLLATRPMVYYKGTELEYNAISIAQSNTISTVGAQTHYFYAENKADVPTGGSNYWHYDENGEIAVW